MFANKQDVAGALGSAEVARHLLLPGAACVAGGNEVSATYAASKLGQAVSSALEPHLYPAVLSIVLSYCAPPCPYLRVVESSASDVPALVSGFEWLVQAVLTRAARPWSCAIM